MTHDRADSPKEAPKTDGVTQSPYSDGEIAVSMATPPGRGDVGGARDVRLRTPRGIASRPMSIYARNTQPRVMLVTLACGCRYRGRTVPIKRCLTDVCTVAEYECGCVSYICTWWGLSRVGMPCGDVVPRQRKWMDCQLDRLLEVLI